MFKLALLNTFDYYKFGNKIPIANMHNNKIVFFLVR